MLYTHLAGVVAASLALSASGVAAQQPRSDVLIQAFYWTSTTVKPNGWYDYVGTKINDLSGYFDGAWFPPPSDCGDKNGEGYLPREWYNFTGRYGTEQSLRTVLKSLTHANIAPIADVVINHRVGTKQYADFFNPQFPDNAAAVCRDDDWVTVGGRPTGNPDSGDGYEAGRDLDHDSPVVRSYIIEFMQKLKGLGFAGWRYDFVHGFRAAYIKTYNDATTPSISIGEMWLGVENDAVNNPQLHRKNISDWVENTEHASTAFDFTTKFLLNRAVRTSNYALLKIGDAPAGVIGVAPGYAVTFVDNHDTGVRINAGETSSSFPADKLMQGYAYILTHPGVPTVFWPHYIELNNKPTIDPLIKARKAAGVNSMSKVIIRRADNGGYAAYISGTSGSLAVRIGPNTDWLPCDKYTTVGQGDGWAVWQAAPF